MSHSICMYVYIYICVGEGERQKVKDGEKERERLQVSCCSPAYLMSRQSLSSESCQCFGVGGQHHFHREEFSLISLPLIFFFFFSIHPSESPLPLVRPSSSQIQWCGMSRDRRGSESQPLITEWAPAARVRDSFAEGKKLC